jgi:hypothetical protein
LDPGVAEYADAIHIQMLTVIERPGHFEHLGAARHCAPAPGGKLI